jgi:hypothetical protein
MSKLIKTVCMSMLVLILIDTQAQVQTEQKSEESFAKGKAINTGFQIQWYPAGLIPSIESEWVLTNRLSLSTRLGMNLADRQDFSPFHDHEEGEAFGGSIGLRYYRNANSFKGWFIGLKTDLWDMTIDWGNTISQNTKGSTDILILQPTFELGYLHQIGNSKWNVGASLALGFEINIKTVGEEVAQGKVSLLGLGINRTL